MSAVKKTGYLLPKENQNKTQYKTAKRKAKKRKCAYFLRELFFPVICAYIKYCAVERMRKRVKSKEKERETKRRTVCFNCSAKKTLPSFSRTCSFAARILSTSSVLMK